MEVTFFAVDWNNRLEVTMQIKIQARDFSMTEAIRQYVERRIRYALSNSYQHIKRIMVRLSDINGPRGGDDKRCHIELLVPGQTLIVADTKSDLYSAVNSASFRARRSLGRWVRRTRDGKRIQAPPKRLLLEHDA